MDNQQKQKRQKTSDIKSALDVVWYSGEKPMDRSFKNAGPDSFHIKNGMFSFGSFLNKQEFVEKWANNVWNQGNLHEIYEVISTGRVKLYFDIESVYPGGPPDPQILKDWLLGIIKIIQAVLKECGIEDRYTTYVTMNDCRDTADGFKRSFHLIFQTSMKNNNIAMKRFVNEMIMPRIQKDTRYQWIAQYKNGPTVKYAVDPAPYNQNNAFRVAFAKKQDKRSCLVPWDVDKWNPIEFKAQEDMESWLEKSLISQPDEEYCQMLNMSQPDEEDSKNCLPSVASPAVVERKSSGNEKERQFTTQVLSLLCKTRATDRSKWINVGFATATVFDGDLTGLHLFQIFSSNAHNYNEAAATKIYNESQRQIGLGSFVNWIKEDQPVISTILIAQLKSTVIDERENNEDVAVDEGLDDIVEGTPDTKKTSRLNEGVIHEMVSKFNSKWNKKEIRLQQKEFRRAREDLLEEIVVYMNKWLCIIRKLNGNPLVIEEYTEFNKEMDSIDYRLQPNFVMRNTMALKLAYEKHTLVINNVDSDGTLKKQRISPAVLWLTHQKSREADTIVFDLLDKENSNPRVFNLYRGLAIEREDAIYNSEDERIFSDHIRDVWCNGDSKMSDYSLDSLAHLIQKPGVKMGTVILLKGGQGAGKGAPINIVARILGEEHFIQSLTIDSVTGRFQDEKIKTNLWTFLDECLYGKDKKQAAAMKGLVSENRRRIETKFVNPITIANHSNFIAASNHDNMMFVEHSNRRYICLEVNDKFTGVSSASTKAYFDRFLAIKPAHIAHMLYNRDISKFNPREFPSTEYQRYQKVLNFDTIYLFVEECLQRGYFVIEFPHENDELIQTPDVWEQGGGVMNKDSLYNAYSASATHACNKYNSVENSTSFFATLQKLIKCENCKVGSRGEQSRCLRFSTLGQSRLNFQSGVSETEWKWTKK
jgi:hypothetical protein